MRRLLRRWVAPIAIVVGLLAPSMAMPAVAYSNLCITHLSKMSGPGALQRHTTGNLVAPAYTHKLTIIETLAPAGYWYISGTVLKKCV